MKFEKKSLGSEASWKSTNPSSAVTIAVAMARRARIRDGRSMMGDWTGLANGKEQTEGNEGVCRGSGQWTGMQYTSLQ